MPGLLISDIDDCRFDLGCLMFELLVCDLQRPKAYCIGQLPGQCFNERFDLRILREVFFQILNSSQQMCITILN